jgi:hypothetical protein
MRNLFVVIVLGGLVGCGGDDGLSPAAACSQAASAACQKLYQCLTEPERMAAGLPATEAACVTEFEADQGCAAMTEMNACDTGETYHSDQAQHCIHEFQALDCEAVRSGMIDENTPACQMVCTVG